MSADGRVFREIAREQRDRCNRALEQAERLQARIDVLLREALEADCCAREYEAAADELDGVIGKQRRHMVVVDGLPHDAHGVREAERAATVDDVEARAAADGEVRGAERKLKRQGDARRQVGNNHRAGICHEFAAQREADRAATKKQIMGRVASNLPSSPSFRTIERALQSQADEPS